jgi:hypothetical protein
MQVLKLPGDHNVNALQNLLPDLPSVQDCELPTK